MPTHTKLAPADYPDRVPVFDLNTGKFLGTISPKDAVRIVYYEPTSLMIDRANRRRPRVTIHLKDLDILLYCRRTFRIESYLAKGYSLWERLHGLDDWIDIHGIQHSFFGHRVFSLLPSRKTPTGQLLEGLRCR